MATKKTAKPPTLASLVRQANHSEQAFVDMMLMVLGQGDVERSVEYLTRLNLPRTFEEAETDIPSLEDAEMAVTDFQTEVTITGGIEKFIERHVRKLKWLVNHPDVTAIGAGVRLYRSISIVTELRIRRILALMEKSEVLNPFEWGTTRELLNRAYRDFRRSTSLLTHEFFESMVAACAREEVRAPLEQVPAVLRGRVIALAALREQVEVARQTLAVQPEGYPLVKPPRYFGGDLLETGSWKHFWGEVGTLQDSLRQHVEML